MVICTALHDLRGCSHLSFIAVKQQWQKVMAEITRHIWPSMGERPIVPDHSKCTEESAAVPTKNPSCFSVPKKRSRGGGKAGG